MLPFETSLLFVSLIADAAIVVAVLLIALFALYLLYLGLRRRK